MTSLFVDGIIDVNISLLVFIKLFIGNFKIQWEWINEYDDKCNENELRLFR